VRGMGYVGIGFVGYVKEKAEHIIVGTT